jgi:ribosome biogenesis protein MAK21
MAKKVRVKASEPSEAAGKAKQVAKKRLRREPARAPDSSDEDVQEYAKNEQATDATLLDEVRAFAAELGFAGAGEGSAFTDFDPSKAKKKVKKERSDEETRKVDKGTGEDLKAAPEKRAKKQPLVRNEANDFTVPELSAIPKNADKLKSVFSAKEQGMWYELVPEAAALADTSKPRGGIAVDEELVAALRERAAKLLEVESLVAARDAAKSKDSGVAWLQQAKQGGTTTDKVAAMAVLVQEHPIAHLKSLESLVAMAGKRGGARAVVGTTLDAMVELWRDVLLPPDRKLKYFYQQPLSNLPESSKMVDRCLVAWAFEDQLKHQYAAFVERLELLSTDNLDFIKERATKTAFQLLLHRSEQEGQLLKLVVNKLGDPERKAASNAGYMLTKLLAQHGGMKHVVVREIENFIYRPGLKDRARYYAVVYLNQIVLSNRDAPGQLPDGTTVTLGKRLVDIYFTLFKLIMEGKLGTAASIAQAKQDKEEKQRQDKAKRRGKKKFVGGGGGKGQAKDDSGDGEKSAQGDRQGTMDSRMLSALITGIRRAFPYVASEEVEPLIDAHSHSLFKLVHTGSFGVATQALLLLYQLMSSQSSISDRFYRALYAALLNKELPVSTKAPLFLSLFLKAVKDDVSTNRSAALVKRLLQVALAAQANFACGCLIVVSEIFKSSPALWNMTNDAEELEDGDGDDAGMYDPSKRDPQYAHAERSCTWELLPLSRHAHPSVSAMAKSMLAGVPIQYNGDPLKDFVLSEFLSKFIAKKTKPKKVQGGDSYMQPTAAATLLDSFEKRSVAPDEAFFQKFFEIRDNRAPKRKAKKAQAADVSDEDSSLAEDDFLAGEEGDDATFGDIDGVYDYDQLAAAMQEDETARKDSELSADSSDTSSLDGAQFSSGDDDSDREEDDRSAEDDDGQDDYGDSDLDLVESDLDVGGKDDDVFASLEQYQSMIEEDLDGE